MFPLTMFSHIAPVSDEDETYKIVVGAYLDDDNGSDSGSAYIYDLDGTNEVKIAATGYGTENFGYSVAVGHEKVVVGARFSKSQNPGWLSDAGLVYVYDLDGTNEVKITASDSSQSDYFGTSVAVGNNKIVVGATSSSGKAYIYDLDATNEVKLTPSDSVSGDKFGHSVSVGSNKVAVGAFQAKAGGTQKVGQVYIYDLDGTNEVKIKASDGFDNQFFGFSVAVGNNKIVVGAYQDDDNGPSSGAAYVYDLDGSNEVKITASDISQYHKFGTSVAVGSNKVVVGSASANHWKGAVYVYDLDGTNEVKITSSDGYTFDRFGNSVSIIGNKIVVGAYMDDDDNSNSGSVYVYDLDGTNEVKITASDAAQGDYFGYGQAIG